MATKPVSRAEAAKIARRTDTVGAYAGKGWVQAVAFVMLLGFTIMAGPPRTRQERVAQGEQVR